MTTIIIVAVTLLAAVAIIALLLYGFSDLDREAKKRQLLAMLDIGIRLSQLEARLSSGELRSPDECAQEVAKYARAIQEVERFGKLETPL
jgi:hypothetical protein